MFHILSYSVAQLTLAKQDHVVQALALDREHKPFCKGIEIRTSGRESDAPNAGLSQQPLECHCEHWISVVDHEPIVKQEAIEDIREIPSDLLHPCV